MPHGGQEQVFEAPQHMGADGVGFETAGHAEGPVGDVGVRGVECALPARAHGIGDGPVQPGRVQFLVSPVADGHHKILRFQHVGHQLRLGTGQVEPVASAGGHGARVHAFGRMDAGRNDGHVADPAPVGLGELRPRRVLRADEGYPPRLDRPGDTEQRVAGRRARHIGAAAVAFGAVAGDEARRCEDGEMVGEEIGRHVEADTQLAGGQVAVGERLDDGEPAHLAEGGVGPRPCLPVLHAPLPCLTHS